MHPYAAPEVPVEPLVALHRICFLLERSRESSYRIDAFRRAMDTVRGIAPDELRQLATTGTVKDLPGIGSTSAQIIADALAGRQPAYLRRLEDERAQPLAERGADLYRAVQGDLHCHSNWSDGGSSIDELVLTARELGHSWLALTDHSPRLKVANGLSAERLIEQIGVVRAIDEELDGTMRFLTGIEVDILDDGSLDQRSELLGALDVVTASVHNKLAMPAADMTRRMVRAVQHPAVDVLGHCTGQLVEGDRGTRGRSQFDAERVFTACRANGVAVEINSRPERCDPPDELIEMALELGCLFAIDSDAHAPGQLELKAYGCARAEDLGIPAERIVTTWDVDRLLAWTSRDRS